jgi:hypothetical protein
MLLKSSLVFFVFAIFFQNVKAQYGTCDFQTILTSVGQTVSVNHLASRGTCRYQILAPIDTFIQAVCTLTLTTNLACSNRQFLISGSGEKDFKDGITYCASGTINKQSIGNEMVVAYRASSQNAGSFNCKFTAVSPTNSNCDCGWNINQKIVGGSTTGVNEFVSHAGLVDSATREIFCGAIISKKS